jgi:hypothetical protein
MSKERAAVRLFHERANDGAAPQGARSMKFMLLMNGTQTNFQTFGTMSMDDLKTHVRFMKRFTEELQKTGKLVAAEGLDISPKYTRIVRATKHGAPSVVDGPFAETKEFLAGYWIVQVADLDEAVAIAARASAAPGAGGEPINIPIEVRLVADAPPVEV